MNGKNKEKEQIIRKRLQVAIKLIIRENPIMPTEFKFEG